MTLSRLSRDRVQHRLVVVFKIFLPEQVSTAFSGGEHAHVCSSAVHAEVEDLLEAFKALSQDRVQQLVVLARVPGERFTGRIWHMPAAGIKWLH